MIRRTALNDRSLSALVAGITSSRQTNFVTCDRHKLQLTRTTGLEEFDDISGSLKTAGRYSI